MNAIQTTGEREWSEIQAGDPRAFESLVNRHKDAVAALAYAVTGDLAGSEDIAQETFLVAWQSRAQLREPSRLAAWLCGIARNLARQWQRQRGGRTWASPQSGLAEPFDRSPSPSQRVISEEERQIVWGALESLPDIYREALVLFYRESQSVAEVAAALDLTEEAVRQRLSRGRNLLRVEVARLVEQTLEHSGPGPQFTASVMASLGAIGPLATAVQSGGGAAEGTLAAKAVGSAAGSMLAKAVGSGVAAGAAGTALGAAGGLGGAWLGAWAPAQLAPTMTERRLLERYGRNGMIVAVVFTAALIAFSSLFAFRWGVLPATVGMVVSVTGFLTWMIVSNLRMQREVRRIRETVRPEDDPNPTRLKQRLGISDQPQQHQSRWVGRRGTSRSRFLGWPLWDFQVSDPCIGYRVGLGRQPLQARGWLAVGDRATGFIALGGTAFGVIAIGGRAVGLLALGGLAAGAIALGGLAAGGLAIGGMAVGHTAAGGCAVGWQAAGGIAVGSHSAVGGLAVANHAADGGLAISRRFATGGKCRASECNTDAARAAVRESFLAGSFGTAAVLEDAGAYRRRVTFGSLAVAGCAVLGNLSLIPLMYRRRRSANDPATE